MDIEVKKVIDDTMTAFEAFKAANEQALAEIRKNGVVTPELKAKLDKIEKAMDAGEALNAKITANELQAQKAKDEAEAAQKRIDELELKVNRPGLSADPAERKAQLAKQHNAWLRGAVNAITVGYHNLPEEQRTAIETVKAEHKALGLNPDTAGGYLAPVEFVREMIKGVTEMSPVRDAVRVRTTMMKSIQVPKRTGQFSAVWVAEQGTKSETTGLAYGLEEITAHEIYALVDISNQMLEDSAFDMDAELRMEAAEQFAVAEGAAVVSGAAPGKPEGFMVNASVGTTNSGDATEITGDGLLTLKHAIKTAYTRNALWAMNRTTLGSARKLKNGSGDYIWMPGLAAGKPNTIDGDPYVEMPDMPNEGAGLKPVAYGDFRRAYTMVDRIAMEMLRDPYTQATSGNVRFIFRRRVGGQVTLAEAIRTLTCST